MDVDANLRAFFDGHVGSGGRKPNERYASFDYCFNYFQSFRESGMTSALACPTNLHVSCLHLGFYLASWGMMRGSTELLQKSARFLAPAIEMIAEADAALWDLDADRYNQYNVESLCVLAQTFYDRYPKMTDTLVTKIMLGVFGSVPAFDAYFRKGCRAAGILPTFGEKSLTQIGRFYEKNSALIDRHRLRTLDFITGEPTHRSYTRAKVVDMALYMEGALSDQLRESEATSKPRNQVPDYAQ